MADAKPIVKWSCGKGRLAPRLIELMPPEFGRYCEPFAGGAALFCAVRPERAILADVNRDLINLYRVVREAVGELVVALQRFSYTERCYYTTRRAMRPQADLFDGAPRDLVERAAAFLYRVNSEGEFNVPMGAYTNPTICDEAALRAFSALLNESDTVLIDDDFEAACAELEAGDFVYFDPPHDGTFDGYTGSWRGEQDQRRLAACFRGLTEIGVHCMLSNSATTLIEDELYAHQGYWIHHVLAQRVISQDANGRRPVIEVVITNYEPPEAPCP